MPEMRKSCCKAIFAAHKKRARPPRPGSAIRRCVRQSTRCASELVAQSSAGDIDREPFVEIVKAKAEHRRRVEVAGPAEVVVQPFAPQEPAIATGPKLPFKSHSSDPAELVGEGRYRVDGGDPVKPNGIGRVHAEMAPGHASGAVEEPVGHYQIAKPSAGGGQFLDLDLVRERVEREECGEGECGRLLDVRAAEVNFQTADDRSPLPVVAELEAENATLWAHVGWYQESCWDAVKAKGFLRFDGRVTPAAAAAAGGGLTGRSAARADPAPAATAANNPIPTKKSRRMKSSLLIPHASSGVERS